jgi:RNA polymerase sigma-70 factor (ECF subfamily)
MSLRTLSTTPGDLEGTFRAHHAEMLQAAYRITGSAQDAEDVLQTVFLRLIRREAPIVLQSDEGSYLRRAAVNSALDLVRSRRRATVIPFDQAAVDRSAGNGEARGGSLADDELRAWLRGKLAEMSPMAAQAFALRYFEEFTNPEIADMLGTSQNSVAVILHRTRRRLAEELKGSDGRRE